MPQAIIRTATDRARTIFLTVAGVIGLAVGGVSVVLPGVLLASKGVTDPTAEVWLREVGVLLVAVGLLALLVRRHVPSVTLRAVLICNAIVQFGLFPIEIIGVATGQVGSVSGILPNSVLHPLLGIGFTYFAVKMNQRSSVGN